MRFNDMVKELERLGYVFSRVKGSHYLYTHIDAIRPIILCHKSRNNMFGPALVNKILNEAKRSIELGREAKANKR
jgi:predicted RNA binding protein YcfA (HicA-like mRNA interferase family)